MKTDYIPHSLIVKIYSVEDTTVIVTTDNTHYHSYQNITTNNNGISGEFFDMGKKIGQ